MIYYDRIDVSEGIDNTETRASNKFQSSVCNGCHDVLIPINVCV